MHFSTDLSLAKSNLIPDNVHRLRPQLPRQNDPQLRQHNGYKTAPFPQQAQIRHPPRRRPVLMARIHFLLGLYRLRILHQPPLASVAAGKVLCVQHHHVGYGAFVLRGCGELSWCYCYSILSWFAGGVGYACFCVVDVSVVYEKGAGVADGDMGKFPPRHHLESASNSRTVLI